MQIVSSERFNRTWLCPTSLLLLSKYAYMQLRSHKHTTLHAQKLTLSLSHTHTHTHTHREREKCTLSVLSLLQQYGHAERSPSILLNETFPVKNNEAA